MLDEIRHFNNYNSNRLFIVVDNITLFCLYVKNIAIAYLMYSVHDLWGFYLPHQQQCTQCVGYTRITRIF